MNIQKRSRSSVIALPDDLIMEILSRMPALDVLKCRGVCRKWSELISTQHFSEMHLKAKAYHSSMILVHKRAPIDKGALRLLDNWRKPWNRPTIRRSGPYFTDNLVSRYNITVQLSYDGLIVFKSIESVTGKWVFTIFNPISRDVVKVEIPGYRFEVFAMFFNPLIKEYCILLRKYGSETNVEFIMVNLGAQPWCRILKQPFFFRCNCDHPVVIEDDATIYWRVIEQCHDSPSVKELIMSFDIKTEKFSSMPLPDCEDFGHGGMHIVKIDDRLCVAQCTFEAEKTLSINIWTLKDSATRLWTKTHSLSINMKVSTANIWSSNFVVMEVGSEEMLLHRSNYDNDEESVYAYSFERRTIRKVRTYKDRQFSIFVPSLVSLKNCKPRICIELSSN